MITVLYILFAVLLFGSMILTHELGHYLFARVFHVTIHEFSIGMGPKIFSRVSGKTKIRYSLRALPIGGYVSMEGENGESDDPGALSAKPAWQRFLIMAAGASVNLLFGLLLMLVLVTATAGNGIYTNEIYGYAENPSYEVTSDQWLRGGDTVLRIDGRRVYNAHDLSYEIMRRGTEPVDVTVKRNGETVRLSDVVFPQENADGIRLGSMDFIIVSRTATVGGVLLNTVQRSALTIRMVWESLYDLIRGRYGIQAVSGPVGITETIVETADTATKTRDYSSILYIAAVICINLGVMNLLPIPALDGGRLFFLFIEILFRHPVPQKVEAAIHAAGMLLLLAFMAFISIKDIFSLFG